MTERPASRGRSLGARLTVAFIGVAALSVALVVALTIVGTSRETASLGRAERADAARAAALAAARAYRAAGAWPAADLQPVLLAAQQAGGRVAVFDSRGVQVGGGAGPGAGGGDGAGEPGSSAGAPVRVDGREVGRVVFRVRGSGLSRAAEQLRNRLVTIALVGGGLAILLAVAVGISVARRLTAPLTRLTRSARRLAAGDLGARAATPAPGEIGELAAAFDGMAASLADQARNRQALMAEIAHELRTPITIVRGNCEAMLDGVTPPTPEHLASLRDEALRLEALVEDLDTLAISESAGLDLRRSALDLGEVAARAVALFHDRAASREIALASEILQAPMVGDERRVAQIVENLLSNALKFTPPGGRVTVRTRPDEGGRALLEVEDTGRGIAPEDLEHVFERYWRGERAADTGGRGIGLAVVDQLVGVHGGTIEVDSEPGRGTRFRVTFPAS